MNARLFERLQALASSEDKDVSNDTSNVLTRSETEPEAGDLLADSNIEINFSEGNDNNILDNSHSENGQLQQIREGAALIVRMAEVPVIVCGLRNTNRMVPYGSVIPRPAFARVTATWGEARTFSKESTNEEIAAWMESELRRLIPEPK
jgi:hypothetical protein